MRGLRRAALALGIGAVFAAVIRMRGSQPAPSFSGGWSELTDSDLRDAGG